MKLSGRHLESTALDPAAAEIWACEEAYWELLSRGDPGCMALYADDFVGWPHAAPIPRDREAMRGGVEQYARAPQSWSLELVGIAVAGPVAVVHLTREDAVSGPDDPAVPPAKVMHTWIKIDGNWRLLGGNGSQPVLV